MTRIAEIWITVGRGHHTVDDTEDPVVGVQGPLFHVELVGSGRLLPGPFAAGLSGGCVGGVSQGLVAGPAAGMPGDQEGQRRTTVEIDAEEVAVSLTYATAEVTETYRQGTPSQGEPAPAARPMPDSTQSSPNTAPAEPHPF
jgi:hypothetical protein